jgi:hypothetical protein
MGGAERLDLVEVAGEQRRRHQVGKFGDEDLFGSVAYVGRVVDDQRFRMHTLQQMRCRDVGKVERRILAHQDDVEGRQRGAPGLTQGEVVALVVADLHRLHRSVDLAVDKGEPVRRVIGNRMFPALRFQQQCEGRIAADVDPFDRVHLNGDVKAPAVCHVRIPGLWDDARARSDRSLGRGLHSPASSRVFRPMDGWVKQGDDVA